MAELALHLGKIKAEGLLAGSAGLRLSRVGPMQVR